MPIVIDDPPSLGSYITIYIDNDKSIVRHKIQSHDTFPGCRVIAIDGDSDVFLGWREGEVHPHGVVCHTAPLAATFVGITRTLIPDYQDYLCYHMMGRLFEYAGIDGDVSSSGRNEAPCRQCQRKNDTGTTSCWWCCCANPC